MTQTSKLAQDVGILLAERGLTICAAESCTGGLLTSTLTDVAGSSAYVLGGVVTYSNAAKQQLVKVQESTLMRHGAVSEATAAEMAAGVRDLFTADIGVSVTGIAGPGGGTAEKPVGLVYIGVATAEGVQVQRHIWAGDRIENKVLSVAQALRIVSDIVTWGDGGV